MNREELQDLVSRVSAEQFSRSSGPGGQNVNKLNTRVTLRVPLASLSFSEQDHARLSERLANRVNVNGELVVHASETRSRETNRVRALQRATALIEDALHIPHQRRPSRPGRAARERRLREKRITGKRKRDRSEPSEE
ncbi:MAG: aminoacyl-tRNA hydrolase [Spirochaeta sp.]|nr:aminoacyl-tRNA hydrolase [Spirochaeta sp.]